MTTFDGDYLTKADVCIAKNYLTEKELQTLNLLVDRFLDYAELQALEERAMTMAEMGELQDAIDAANGWDLDSQLSQAMDALQCPDPDMPVNVLSGGERRRVALCKLRH